MKPQHNLLNRRGFSLIEMIVVIIIVSLVMGLLLPGLAHVRRNMRTTRGLVNLKEMTQLIYSYAAENRTELPLGIDDTGFGTDWSIGLNDFMTGTGDNYNVVGDGGTPNVPQIQPIFRDPHATFPNQGYLHYSVHPVLMPDKGHIDDDEVSWRRYKLGWMKRPAEVVLIMDAIQHPTANVPYSSFATAKRIGNIELLPANQSGSGQAQFPDHVFYDKEDEDNDDNDDLVNPDPNDYDAVNVDTVPNAGNIRWRQYDDSDAKFAFPDGHAETIGIGELLKRNIRADRYE